MINYGRFSKIILLVTASIISVMWSSPNVFAEDAKPGSQLTWKDLGFIGSNSKLSTDELPLVESLNAGRGVWSFEGTISTDDIKKPIRGKLDIKGSAKSGMLPMWSLNMSWPQEYPKNMVNYVIMVAPEKNQIRIMLIQAGPYSTGPDGKTSKDDLMKIPRIPFEGTWDLEHRTILWTKKKISGKAALEDPMPQTTKMESFEMVFSDTGKVTIQNAQNHSGPSIAGKVSDRIGQPKSEEKLIFNNDIHYATRDDVTMTRIQQYIPQKAVNITVNLQRNGHFARYRISQNDFLIFLNALWKGEKRDEGVVVSKDKIMKQNLNRLGWKPFESAIKYNSPVKPNGAMSTYYFDSKTETVYENTGYW